MELNEGDDDTAASGLSRVGRSAHAAGAGASGAGVGDAGAAVAALAAVDSCFFARLSARSWWCFDLPDAASATILAQRA